MIDITFQKYKTQKGESLNGSVQQKINFKKPLTILLKRLPHLHHNSYKRHDMLKTIPAFPHWAEIFKRQKHNLATWT